MKVYIHLVLFLLCITSFLTAQSLYNSNQDLHNFTNKDYVPSTPILQKDVMGENGFIGFTLFTCLGLVVFIVKKDRDTMTRLVESLNNNVQSNSNKIELLERTLVAQGDKIISQMEILNKNIIRGVKDN